MCRALLPQGFGWRTSSGSLAIFAAMRRPSSAGTLFRGTILQRKKVLDLFLKIVSFGGATILTFMGAYVTIYPLTNRSPGKKWWLAGFALLGFQQSWRE